MRPRPSHVTSQQFRRGLPLRSAKPFCRSGQGVADDVRPFTPGGALCFEVGILGGISPLWYRLIGQIGLGTHVWLYSEKALYLLLAQAGLQLEYVKRFGLAPEVLLSRCARIVKYVAVLTLTAARPLRLLPSPAWARQRYDRWEDDLRERILRYRLGGIAPRLGPQTLFVVARPLSDHAPGGGLNG